MCIKNIWEIKLYVYGPIKLLRNFEFKALKEWHANNHSFYSNIIFENYSKKGLRVYITAKATTPDLAKKAALIFFTKIIECLSFEYNLPLKISNIDNLSYKEAEIKRIIQKEDIEKAYTNSRTYIQYPIYQRALSWYTKSLTTENIFDKFLAFWNSIEIIASKYHPDTERARNGSKSQIWECFKEIWGEISEWPIITNDNKWIDDNHEIRNSIAHGSNSLTITDIENIDSKIATIKEISYKFIYDWKDKLSIHENNNSEIVFL